MSLLVLLAAACSGRIDDTRPLPNVVGLPYNEAVQRFDTTGFCVASVNAVESPTPVGTILKQSPRAGYEGYPLFTVGVEVSSGAGDVEPISVVQPANDRCPRTTYYSGDPFGPSFPG